MTTIKKYKQYTFSAERHPGGGFRVYISSGRFSASLAVADYERRLTDWSTGEELQIGGDVIKACYKCLAKEAKKNTIDKNGEIQ